MHSINFEVINTVCGWLEKGDYVYFVTVLKTWGASPRPVGSLFAYNPAQKSQVGSLSGGCIEEDLIVKLQEAYTKVSTALLDNFNADEHYSIMRYGDLEGDDQRYALPCGGVLELLVETLCCDSAHSHFLDIQACLSNYKPIARSIRFHQSSYCYSSIKEGMLPSKSFVFDQNTALYHRLDPIYQLLIVGAGDVTSYLSDLAKMVDFQVTICEPRKDYLSRLSLLANTCTIEDMLPDDLIRSKFMNPYSAIVCLAHDPRVDDMALLESLSNSEAFYIGAMGSIKTTENRIERLKSLGLEDKQIRRLCAPIGIDIKSKTPPEIAISILAELISVRYSNKGKSFPA